MATAKNSIYLSKTLFFGTSTIFRKASIIIREKQSYQKNGLGIWWKRDEGTGIIGKPNRVLRHFMFGTYIFNKVAWFNFSYLGYTKIDIRLKLKDQGE